LTGVGLFGALTVSLLAGWLSGVALRRRSLGLGGLGWGLAGGLVGDSALGLLHIPQPGGLISALVIATSSTIVIRAGLGLISRPWRRP